VSIMVADFVLADYGWLRSPNGNKSAHVIFWARKAHEGYFTNEDIVAQAECAMEILEKYYPGEDHVFVYDCASTHLKHSDESLLASKMPKNTSKPDQNFGVIVNIVGEDGKPVYGPDGKILKQKIRMRNGWFRNGTEQEFYYPDGHPKAGLFKGMAQILTECGYDVSKKKAQCRKKFSACPENAKDCCCRHLLYNKPDFVAEELLLGTCCKNWGFQVLFLPKFHCELNFMEQCWGYAK